MTSLRTRSKDSVSIDGPAALVSLAVTSSPVVEYLTAIAPDDRAGAVLRLLDLGVEMTRRMEQRADAVAADDVRRSIGDGLAVVRKEVAESVDHLTRLAAATSERLGRESAALSSALTAALTELPGRIQQAVSEAASDADLVDAVAEVLAGDESPIVRLETQLTRSLDRVQSAHVAALGAAVEQVTAAAGYLNRVRGSTEARDRSPAGGIDYEAVIENVLTVAAQRRGDRTEDVRHVTGQGGSKKGDFLAHAVDGEMSARVAVEVKRTDAGLSASKAEALVRDVSEARDAHAVLLVCATPQGMPAGLRNGETIGMVGSTGLAVCVPPDEDYGALSVAYSLVRALALSARSSEDRQRTEVDLAAARQVIAQARHRLQGLHSIEKAISKAKNELASQARHLQTWRTDLMSDLEALMDSLASSR